MNANDQFLNQQKSDFISWRFEVKVRVVGGIRGSLLVSLVPVDL